MNAFFDRVSTTGARYAERLTLDRMRFGEERGNRSFYGVDYFDRLSLGNANQIVPAIGLAYNSYTFNKQKERQPLAHSWLNRSGEYAFLDIGAGAFLRERCAAENTLFQDYPTVERNDTDVLIIFASSTVRLHNLRLRVRREVEILDAFLQAQGVYKHQTAYVGSASWDGMSDTDSAEYTLNANKLAANVLSAEGALELMVAKQRFLSERYFNFGHLPLRGLYVWDSPGFGLKTPTTVERVELGDGCNSTAIFAAAGSGALQNGGVAVLSLGRGVNLNEYGRFRVTIILAATMAESQTVGIDVELLDLGAHSSDDKFRADALQDRDGLPPFFALRTEGPSLAKIGPDFRPDAADRITHGRVRAR